RARRRRAERAERRAAGLDRLLRQDGILCMQALAHQPAERVGLLERLAAGERRDGRLRPFAQDALDLVESLLPAQPLEAARAGLAERGRDPVGGGQVGETGPPLVAQPSVLDLGVVA